MSQHPCTISECPRTSRVLCYCCKNNYCIEHLKDHNDIYLSQLYQLTNDINKLSEYFRGQYRQQLDQWRHESHQTIDLYYEKKCQELDNKTIQNETINQNRQVIEWIKLKINQLIREQDTTQEQIDSLKAATNAVKREIEQIPTEDFQLNIPPLILDENFIQIEKRRSTFNLHATIKSLFLTKKIITDDSLVMANNSTYFLINQQSNLCLYDKNLNMIKQVIWEYGCIWDMCMSNTLSKFILVAENGVFTLDVTTMIIEQVKSLSKENTFWYCCACSNKSLFLTTQQLNTTIYEYVLIQNNFSLKRQQIYCSNNEYIEHMKCTKDLLALIILNDSTGERRLDMCSTLTFDQLWTISLSINEKLNVVSCCSLNEKGWLIVNVAQARLIHVNNQGYMKQSIIYKPLPQYAIQFDDDTLAILTENGINLHKIE
ncbi:unnamed protein product [Rotaria sp. Silwood1]|nr:unnamed protein product [Rotaria sp. Silwood1]CAF0755326.1 unnamed protein product [Rotaria sp. Silwood1]CAF3330948.1 unnamed protein product [Rotaria sp. Silwood1]CAF4832219.1 unnamed protein product [Rotaria sp. Silwood1]CAF4839250.1 unnamed protein product [Rotaria sp. Silwood1]